MEPCWAGLAVCLGAGVVCRFALGSMIRTRLWVSLGSVASGGASTGTSGRALLFSMGPDELGLAAARAAGRTGGGGRL